MKINDPRYDPPPDQGPFPGEISVRTWPKWPAPSSNNSCEAYPTTVTTFAATVTGTLSIDQISALAAILKMSQASLSITNQVTAANVTFPKAP